MTGEEKRREEENEVERMEEKSREERNGIMNFKVKNTKRVCDLKKKIK